MRNFPFCQLKGCSVQVRDLSSSSELLAAVWQHLHQEEHGPANRQHGWIQQQSHNGVRMLKTKVLSGLMLVCLLELTIWGTRSGCWITDLRMTMFTSSTRLCWPRSWSTIAWGACPGSSTMPWITSGEIAFAFSSDWPLNDICQKLLFLYISRQWFKCYELYQNSWAQCVSS